MKKITPYKSYRYALASLDNGGRFYNFLSRANDGDISSAELAKAAGILSGRQAMILYLEMSLMDLEEDMKKRVLSHLSKDLKTSYSKHKPASYSPAEAKKKAVVSKTSIITGIPKLVDSKTKFNGFIMVPIITDKTTTFSMIPVYDQYDIYEVRDEESNADFFIAHNRSTRKLPERLTRCGGVIKELNTEENKESDKELFLEVFYYSN